MPIRPIASEALLIHFLSSTKNQPHWLREAVVAVGDLAPDSLTCRTPQERREIVLSENQSGKCSKNFSSLSFHLAQKANLKIQSPKHQSSIKIQIQTVI